MKNSRFVALAVCGVLVAITLFLFRQDPNDSKEGRERLTGSDRKSGDNVEASGLPTAIRSKGGRTVDWEQIEEFRRKTGGRLLSGAHFEFKDDVLDLYGLVDDEKEGLRRAVRGLRMAAGEIHESTGEVYEVSGGRQVILLPPDSEKWVAARIGFEGAVVEAVGSAMAEVILKHLQPQIELLTGGYGESYRIAVVSIQKTLLPNTPPYLVRIAHGGVANSAIPDWQNVFPKVHVDRMKDGPAGGGQVSAGFFSPPDYLGGLVEVAH